MRAIRVLGLCLVVVLALGTTSASAVTFNGAAAWGWNVYGQLGDGTFTGPEACAESDACSMFPVAVSGLSEVTAIAGSGADGMALLSNGTVMTWGANSDGQLGDGTFTGPELCVFSTPCSTTPVPVSGLSEVTAIAIGDDCCGEGHSVALLRNGTVMDWGRKKSDVPVAVSGITTATAVAAGLDHTCALLSGGGVDCWGNNEFGELGNGTGEGSSTPVAVSGITNAVAISAAGLQTCALLLGGSIDCWGANQNGQLGDGTSTGPETCSSLSRPCSKTPVAVSGITSATAVTAGEGESCALLSGGSVDCWGLNFYGQLGDGTSTGPEKVCGATHEEACSTTPVAVSGITNATAVTTGGYHSCALLSGGSVDCWGWNVWGELGDGIFTGPETCGLAHFGCSTMPVAVRGLSKVAGISSSGDFTLAYGPTLRIVAAPRAPSAEEAFGEENPGEPNQKRACAGDPVSCATGNLSESQTDLSLSGRGVPLALTRTYNAQGAVTQPSAGLFGYGWSSSFGDHLTIDSTAETVTVVQANGSAVTFSGVPGVPGELTAPRWAQAKLVLNGDGTYLYTLPSQETFHFDASGRLLSESDRSGNTTTMNRSSEGRLESVTDAAGRKLTFSYDSEGQVESVKDPLGHTVKYSYEAGNLTSVTLPGETGARWQFKYDSSHRLTTMTDGRGGKTVNEYDSSNRVISQKDPAERTIGFEYEPLHTTITNKATGSVTKEVFTQAGEPESITHGYGTSSVSTETFTYDEAGDLKSATDGNKHTVKYGYNGAGDRTSMIDADEHETKWTYNGTHDVLTTTTPDGETTTYVRNSAGEPESVSRPAPGSTTQTTKYTYDSHGDMESMTDPLGRVWKYEYDGRGDRTSETDPEGDKRTWEYDEDSREIAMVSPRGNVTGGEASKYTTKVERDTQGRPLTVTDPLGHKTKYTYDASGNLETQTDPNGNKTKYTYDADNEQTKVEQPNATVTETGYDGAGQVTSQTDGNKHTTKYVRNVLEQVVEVIDPRERKTTKEYDKAGNVTKLTDAAKRTTTNTYDAANRLNEVSYSDGKTHAVKYEYNGDGLRTHIADGTGETSYTYDQLDRLTESKDGHGDKTGYEYDLANELTKITYPNGKAVTRVYDKAGRLEKITDWLEHTTKFAYDPDSDLATTTFPAGTSNVDKYAYNEADQMSEAMMTKGAEALASLAYTRDNDGQVKGVTSKGLPGEEKPGYTYDPNNRVTKAGTTGYEYDAANDPTKIASNTYTYNAASELETSTGFKYTYDELGERTKTSPTSGAATTYSYDQAGNLTAVERPKEGKTAEIKDTYTYDGNDLRASQTISGKTTFLTWQMNEAVPLILNDGTNSYIYGPGGLPIEQISSGGTALYLHHDQQGSTRLLTSSTGKNEATTTYDAYGNTTGTTGTATTPLGYDAQYTSADTGLIYLRARTYDPKTAQFLSVDQLVRYTRAPYNYASDDPLNEGDPSGLCNENPFTGGFWTEGNCLSGAVGGPNGGGSQPAWWDIPAYGAVAVPCIFGGEVACAGAASASIAGSLGCTTTGTVYPNYNDPTQPPGPGWEWRGNGPVGSNEGSWFNPRTDQSVHPDLDHPPGKAPHYDYKVGKEPKTEIYPGDPIPEVPEL